MENYAEESDDYAEKMPDYADTAVVLKIIKLFP